MNSFNCAVTRSVSSRMARERSREVLGVGAAAVGAAARTAPAITKPGGVGVVRVADAVEKICVARGRRRARRLIGGVKLFARQHDGQRRTGGLRGDVGAEVH